MATVMVEIRRRPGDATGARLDVHATPEPEGPEIVGDVEEYLESAMCSCSASDDNPY